MSKNVNIVHCYGRGAGEYHALFSTAQLPRGIGIVHLSLFLYIHQFEHMQKKL